MEHKTLTQFQSVLPLIDCMHICLLIVFIIITQLIILNSSCYHT